MHTTETTTPAGAPEKLAFHRQELARSLGVSVVTLWRAEKRGLLKRVPGVGVPIYSRAAVDAFLAGKTAKAG